MAQYFNDFTQYPLATKLDAGGHDFAVMAGRSDYVFQAEADARGASGRVLRVSRGEITGPTWWRWSAVPSVGSGEMYIEAIAGTVENGDTSARKGVLSLLCNANADATQGYCGVDSEGGGAAVIPGIRRADTPSTGAVTGTAYTFIAEKKRCLLFRWEDLGTTVELKYKTWWSDAAEPASWTVQTTNAGLGSAPYWASGFVGFGRFDSYSIATLIAFIGVGTGTDAAPRAPIAGSTPVAFSGTVPNQAGTEGAPFSLNLSTYFTGTQTPFSYAIQSGSLPAGLSLNASTGVISGTPSAAGASSGIVIRATDATPDTADTNPFSITISAPEPGNTDPVFDGPNIADISATEGVALSSLDVSTRFSDAESALTFSAVGSWPAGVTVSSAGVISGTPTTAGTYSGLQVRATDAGALTADSNAFTITVAAAALPSTITVIEPLKNNTGTLLANLSGVRVAVLQAATLVSVYETPGLTTNASGILATISDSAITAGQQYHVAIKLADGSVGITGPITAS